MHVYRIRIKLNGEEYVATYRRDNLAQAVAALQRQYPTAKLISYKEIE